MTLRALIIKEWIQTLHDRRMLVIIFALPVVQMILFGFATNNEVEHLSVLVVDQDRSFISREIISALNRGTYFDVFEISSDPLAGEKALNTNEARLAINIPPGLERRFLSGQNSTLQIQLDGSDGNSATIALGYFNQILGEINEQFTKQPNSSVSFEPLNIETRILYNQSLTSSYFMVPGIIAMILTIVTTMLTAMGITREKERGTFEQLVVSPIRGWELMLGKTMPFAVIGVLDALLSIGLGMFIFDIPLTGSISALSVLNVAYIMAMLGLGLFISTISDTQQQAMMTVFAVLFPFIILSDFFFPLENMPELIQWATLLNPMRYTLTAQREIFLKGSGWPQVWSSILVLFGFAFAFLGYGAFRFRKSLQV